MLDLGIQKSSKDKSDEYNTKFLNQLDPGEEITGEIYIGEMKKRLIKKAEVDKNQRFLERQKLDKFLTVDEFYVIITDHENKQKWICGFITSYYPKSGNIYGEKGGRVYNLIDSLNHALNKDPMNVQESYSVNFDTFRKTVNENVEKVKIKAVQSWNPGAKACNLEVVNAKSSSIVEKHETTGLEQLAHDDPVIKIAYDGLLSKNSEITKKNLAFKLKAMLDNKDITKNEFKDALQKIDKL